MSVSASGYQRIEGDRYYTPAWVTQSLLSVESFVGGIWDPAAGAGHMVDEFPESRHGSDIAPDRPDIEMADFLAVCAGEWPNIATNPPYGVQSRLAVKFVEHALRLTKPHGGKVAMLLKVGFDSAPGRTRLFRDHPAFAAEWRLTRRIAWANIEQKLDKSGRPVGPTEHHSFFVWDWRKRGGAPVKGYLPLRGNGE